MKRRFALMTGIALIAASCNPDANYEVDGVQLSMKVEQVSCGFCEVRFDTDRDAYYYISAEKVREGIDPFEIESQFKTLALDYAYKEYINWRFELLYNGEPHIAEFSSHSLQYGEQDYFFTNLEPDTDYWIFAFVVDPKTNSPAGELILQTIHTDKSSRIKIDFKYRINGTWDFVYPLGENGELNYFLPWVGETADSLKLRDLQVTAPGHYFIDRFETLRETGQANIFYGMYAHNNDGQGDGTSQTLFEEGHIYYTAIASFDGPLILEGEFKNYHIYKFKWTPDLQLVFTKEDDTLGAW